MEAPAEHPSPETILPSVVAETNAHTLLSKSFETTQKLISSSPSSSSSSSPPIQKTQAENSTDLLQSAIIEQINPKTEHIQDDSCIGQLPNPSLLEDLAQYSNRETHQRLGLAGIPSEKNHPMISSENTQQLDSSTEEHIEHSPTEEHIEHSPTAASKDASSREEHTESSAREGHREESSTEKNHVEGESRTEKKHGQLAMALGHVEVSGSADAGDMEHHLLVREPVESSQVNGHQEQRIQVSEPDFGSFGGDERSSFVEEHKGLPSSIDSSSLSAEKLYTSSSTEQQQQQQEMMVPGHLSTASTKIYGELSTDKDEFIPRGEGHHIETAVAEHSTKASDNNGTRQTVESSNLSPSSKSSGAEIITTAPFESVKAAVSLFGERVDWKSPQQTFQTDTSTNAERQNTISEVDIERLQDDIEKYRKRVSDSKKASADILLELESVQELIKAAGGMSKDVTNIHLDFNHHHNHLVKDAKVSEMAVKNKEDDKNIRNADLDKLLKEIEDVKAELLSMRVSRDDAVDSIESAKNSLDSVSKRIEALVEEQSSLDESIAAAQSALADTEEQVALLRNGKEVEVSPDRIPPDHLIKKQSTETKLLAEKLEETNASLRKLREELAVSKEAETKYTSLLAATNNDIEKLQLELAVARSEGLGKVEKVLAELEESKAMLSKAREESDSLSSAVLILREELDTVDPRELEMMHEKEQIACATLASLQDEIQRVKESLHRAQEGLARALEAKETLPAAIKRMAIEADQAKAEATASKEQARKARHEVEQEKAATSTAMSRQAAALKEAEAARASEAMAMAEFKALTESESQYNTETETESEGGMSTSGITITLEEYTSLKQASNEAESIAEKKVSEAVALVEDAKASQRAAQERLSDIVKEAESCRMELEAVRKKAEDAQEAKLASEAALRKWRAEHEQQRRKSANPSGDSRLVSDGERGAVKVTEVKARERRGAGLDAFSQVLSLKVPMTSDVAIGKVLSMQGVADVKEKPKKKTTFIKRLTSAVSWKKAPSAVRT